jgi:ketosteroid isomerase-like protein
LVVAENLNRKAAASIDRGFDPVLALGSERPNPHAAAPAFDKEVGQVESNKDVAIRWLNAVAEGDVATLTALCTSDIVHEIMGTSVVSRQLGRDDLVALAGSLFQVTKSGLQFTILNVTAEEDRVSVQFTGTSELVSGVPYNNVYHVLFRLRDGKICEGWEYCDTKLVDEVLGPLLAQAAQ